MEPVAVPSREARDATLVPRIEARGVSRTFAASTASPVHALGPVDIEVTDGEFVCLLGPSGCGKSTLLRAVAGLLQPSEGEVVLRSARSTGPSLAMVFQDYGIYPWKTVAENVRFGLDAVGCPRDRARQRVADELRRTGLQDFANAYPDTLSGGMRQRVALARALAVDPDLLLLDEPFAALDAQLRALMQEELLRLWEADRRTVLMVTHSLDEAILLGDRIIVMSARPGRVLRSIEVPFPRPRPHDLHADPAFTRLRGELWELLRDEVNTDPASTSLRGAGPDPRPDAIRAPVTRATSGAPERHEHEVRSVPGSAELDPRRHERRRRATDRSLAVGVPLSLLAAWELASTGGFIDARTYPAPSMIVAEAWRLVGDGLLLGHTWASLRRITAGFAIGATTGVALGLGTGVSRKLRAALEPLLSALYTVPKLAILPVFLTMFGFGEAPMIAIITVTVFFFVWIQTMAAVMAVPEGYRETASCFRVSRWQMFRHVLFPAALPSTFVGLRIAAGVSVLVLVAAEFVIGQDGIGFLIFNSRALFINQRMYVGIVVSALIGVAFMALVRWVGRRLLPWAPEDRSVAPK